MSVSRTLARTVSRGRAIATGGTAVTRGGARRGTVTRSVARPRAAPVTGTGLTSLTGARSLTGPVLGTGRTVAGWTRPGGAECGTRTVTGRAVWPVPGTA